MFRILHKVSVYELQRGEYLIRRYNFGKNFLPARAMEEDISPFARQPKTAPPLWGSLCTK